MEVRAPRGRGSTIVVKHRSAMRCSQASLQRALDEVCGRLELEYQLEWGTRPKRLCTSTEKKAKYSQAFDANYS